MLHSTGCFDSVICPFSARGSCQRHYCHFKHDGKAAETMPGQQDPQSPETDVPMDLAPQQCDQPVLPETACMVLELENVSKAIEAVKGEVEQQQHKLLMYKSTWEGEHHNSPTLLATSRFRGTCPDTSMVNILTPKTANSTTVFECELQTACSDSVACNSTLISPHSTSPHKFNALMEAPEEDTLQCIPIASSKIKNDCSVLNKYVIDRCRPCTDLEYDPLLNYSSRMKQTIKKGCIEEKQEFEVIEQSPGKRSSLTIGTARSSQSFEAEISSDDELVIDVPDLPPLNPRVHRRSQKKDYANVSNLSLIRKVRQPRDAESTKPVLDGEKPVDNSVVKSFISETNSGEKELNFSAGQREKKSDLGEGNKFSNVTNGQLDNIGKHQDGPKPDSKTKGMERPLKFELVKKNISAACVNTDGVKSSNRKCRSVVVPEKYEVGVQKCKKTKGQKLIHLEDSKKANDKVSRAERGNPSLPPTAVKCHQTETANKRKYVRKLETRLNADQQRPKIPNQDDHLGHEKRAGSLQITSEKDEESSLSDEDLKSSEELEFSESDPMEECLRIFNESSKQEIKDSETDMEQVFTVYLQCLFEMEEG
ncbi:RNA exonuclease 1 homolog [Scyliorhinus canicula]|uniref:RNA exonuclease 1 homolog n=1 Tax=Scyliorhinus canicula TaxID=7830 RepID=UPI0018F6D3D3|nr:RNA exonuclease 1 homolog [Scyliorhinus canicula]